MTKLEPNLYKGTWIVDDCESAEPERYNAFIEVHCPVCGFATGLEQGQYDWGLGDPFPFLFCPMCGDDKRGGDKKTSVTTDP